MNQEIEIDQDKLAACNEAFCYGFEEARIGNSLEDNPYCFNQKNELWWLFNEGYLKFQEVLI